MLAGPALNELCIAIARLTCVYAPRDRQLLADSQLLQQSKCPKCNERFLLGSLREVKWLDV